MSGMSKKKWKIAALLALSCLVMSPVLAFDAGDVARLVETRSCPCLLYTSPSPRDRG